MLMGAAERVKRGGFKLLNNPLRAGAGRHGPVLFIFLHRGHGCERLPLAAG
jgi:hypothetical protein